MPQLHPTVCTACKQEIYVVFLRQDQREDRGQSIARLSRHPLEGAVIVAPDSLSLPAWTESGQLVHVRTDPQVAMEASGSRVFVEHRLSCPVERSRVADEQRQAREGGPVPDPVTHGPESAGGDSGECRNCQASVIWITTLKGKKTPVDPVALVGVLVSQADAAFMRDAGDPGLRRGYRHDGSSAAIYVADPSDPEFEGQDFATVYESHFATCRVAHATKTPQAGV